MDFALLSKYDDLFTDIFLDALFLWFTTVKMNADHRRPRIPTSKVLDIIQRNVLHKGKLNDAAQEFMKWVQYSTSIWIGSRQLATNSNNNNILM